MMRKHISFRLFLLFFTMVFSLGSFANPPHGNGNGNGNGHQKGRHYQNDNDRNFNKNDGFSSEIKINSHGLVSVSLTYKDARALAIRNNIVGYQSLPPGIAKNLVRGKPLPPGIMKKAIPSNMLNQLPYYQGYEWKIVGNDLVLVAIGTSIIAAVINHVFD
ncbi:MULTISPECIES: anti-virulence regulator CigR family protein [Proteus]|uniref:anti-virulence regulator CigR family protein n=1 Tax=Proteus TaxID=583 RepID=UPI000506926B|nr:MULTISPECIES: anti-virulence regulator CigR family protein [Proteus]AYY81603.1 hypothetical protein EGX81_12275 [Proteus vulgaris]KGA58566.1 putative inner membrane protein [Proteus vulgaris]NBN45550.1 hypothetical protein [Proteus sp. G2626]UBH60960.1 RcnB family protein [Proteus vulgaris]